MSVQMVKQATEVTLGHLQVHRKRYIEEESLYDLIPSSVVKRLAARFPELTVTTRNYSAALASSESGSTGVLVRGVDPVQEPKVTRLLAKTRSGSADLAARLGLSLVTFHAGFLPEAADDPLRTTMVERLRRIVDLFGERGIRVALETGQETAENLLGVLREIDRDEIGVNFDPANMILYGTGDPIDAVRRLAPRISQVHIKDAVASENPGEWGTEVVAGNGAVDWRRFLGVVSALDPPVDLVIEREAGSDREIDIRTAVGLVRQTLADLGQELPV